MSHFDDFDVLFMGDSPKSGCGAVVFLLLLIAVIVYCCHADGQSKNACESHGEKYIDSRMSYTLCEKTDGTVVRR